MGTWFSEDRGEVIKIESNGKVTLTDEDKKSFETVQKYHNYPERLLQMLTLAYNIKEDK